jgi:DNA-binding transcriptional LysR family regulator
LVFVKVAQLGSFTRAAKAMSMPKSTVSRWVGELEATLGARLLERSTRSLRLTEAGSVYYEHASRVVHELEQAERAVTETQTEPKGTLRITAANALNAYLSRLVASFMARYPEVDVITHLTPRVVDLIEEGFDVALRGGMLSDSNLVARRIVADRIRLYASPAYLERHGAPETPEDLARHLCIVLGERLDTEWTLVAARATVRVRIQGRLASDDLGFTRQALLDGTGIGLSPDYFVYDDVISGKLAPVLGDYSLPPGGGLYVVYPSHRFVPAKTRAFVDFAVSHLARCLEERSK